MPADEPDAAPCAAPSVGEETHPMTWSRGRLACLVIASLGIIPGVPGCARPPVAGGGRVVLMNVPAPSLPAGTREAFVYLPPSYDREPARRYPVVFCLHGGPGECDDWFTHGRLRETLDALAVSGRLPEVIAVAPDGHGPGARERSLWANSFDGRARIEDFIVRDVVAWADTALRILPGAAHRTLLGISDGGDAAIRLLVRYPDVFGGAAGLSGRYRPHADAGYEAVTGPPPGRDSVLRSLAALSAGEREWSALATRGSRVYFDAGLLDLAAVDCVRLDRRLAALGVPHESHVYAGWHDWPFWRGRMPAALRAVVR
jgi:enterochelin esterase-like enzyme